MYSIVCHGMPRPVVTAFRSVDLALDLYELLSKRIPPGAKVQLLDGDKVISEVTGPVPKTEHDLTTLRVDPDPLTL